MTESLNLAGGTPGLSQSIRDLATDAKVLAGSRLVAKSVAVVDEGCATDVESDEGIPLGGGAPAYPISPNQSMPVQEPGTPRRPSGVT
jgi:hypothetical protein